MSIRTRQLILLLGIALLPVAVSAWQSLRQIDQFATTIAAELRSSMESRERHYMLEKVGLVGTALDLVGAATEGYLRQQQQALETALQAPIPDTPTELLLSDEIMGTSLEAMSFTFADEQCENCENMAQRLTNAAPELRRIYRRSARFTLWHFAGFSNGLGLVFPAHGNYPEDFDPRQRPWYQDTLRSNKLTWLPLTIDASTSQPVITAAVPLRDEGENTVGVTAIDLPLEQLLSFESQSAPWLSGARLLLLNRAEHWEIIASRKPMQANSTWRSGTQRTTLDRMSVENMATLDALEPGAAILLENFELRGERYRAAFASTSSEANSLLAMLSPHSAIETAIDSAISDLHLLKQQTLQQYLGAALVLAILVSVIAIYFSRRVTAPLVEMSATTRALADGKLETRTGIVRGDEIGLLSSSIDRMADSIEELQAEQEKAYRDMITTLTRALEKKDSYTAGHSGRVTHNALKLGRRIGLDEATLEKLRFGAITHDLGKIGITDSVLNKGAPLNDEEYEIMKQHPSFSRSIMKPLMRFHEYAEIAGAHHERWDGTGYPDGLAGEEIHLLARIVAIADAWDAMVGDRVYRKGMPVEKALEILDREKDDGQFDPQLIREFVAMMREVESSSGGSDRENED